MSGEFLANWEDESNCQANTLARIFYLQPAPAPLTPSTIAVCVFCTFFEICVCVSLCQCEERECVCVCEEIWGKLLERYHRVGGGRWSVSERAVRTCCPARLDSHP